MTQIINIVNFFLEKAIEIQKIYLNLFFKQVKIHYTNLKLYFEKITELKNELPKETVSNKNDENTYMTFFKNN